MSVGTGFQLGQMKLEEGEYTLNGGLGNKILKELKVENGVLYHKENGEYVVSHPPKFRDGGKAKW